MDEEVRVEVEDILLEVDHETSSEEKEVTRDPETLVRTLLRVRQKVKRDPVGLKRSELVRYIDGMVEFRLTV